MERLKFAQKSGITGVYGDETLVPPRVSNTGLLKREHKTGMTDLTVLVLEVFLAFCSFEFVPSFFAALVDHKLQVIHSSECTRCV
jgi:hypothetical protein